MTSANPSFSPPCDERASPACQTSDGGESKNENHHSAQENVVDLAAPPTVFDASPNEGALDDLLMSAEDSPRRGISTRKSNWKTPVGCTPTLSGPNPLRHRWHFGTVNANKTWSPELFGSTIGTVEDLWQHLNFIRLPSAIGESNAFLFISGVSPEWEQPPFSTKPAAGRIDIRIQDRALTEVLLDCCWLYVILSMLGGDSFASGSENIIKGVMGSIRQPNRGGGGLQGRVEVWVAADGPSDGEELRDKLERGFWEHLPLLEKVVGEGPIPQSPHGVKVGWKQFKSQNDVRRDRR